MSSEKSDLSQLAKAEVLVNVLQNNNDAVKGLELVKDLLSVGSDKIVEISLNVKLKEWNEIYDWLENVKVYIYSMLDINHEVPQIKEGFKFIRCLFEEMEVFQMERYL